jgi:hypothetical protein
VVQVGGGVDVEGIAGVVTGDFGDEVSGHKLASAAITDELHCLGPEVTAKVNGVLSLSVVGGYD